jgi:hypothetical protein
MAPHPAPQFRLSSFFFFFEHRDDALIHPIECGFAAKMASVTRGASMGT